MHAADVSAGICGANAIVGASAAIAAGAAWSHRQAGRDRVVVTFFGDGAVNQGVLLEALNLAALRRLPVIFVCENNGFATSMRVQDTTAGTITGRAEAFGIPAADRRRHGPRGRADGGVQRRRPGQGRGRPDVPGVPDLPVRRPPHLGAHGPAALPHRGGGRRGQRHATRWRSRQRASRRRCARGSTTRSRSCWSEARRFVDASPEPDPSGALDYLYADGLRGRAGTA